MAPVESEFPKVGWKGPWDHLGKPPYSIDKDAPFHRWKATGLRFITAFLHLTESKELGAPSITPTIASSHSPILPSDCIASLVFVLLHYGRSLGVITNTTPLYNPQGAVFKNYCGEHLFLTTHQSLTPPRAITMTISL